MKSNIPRIGCGAIIALVLLIFFGPAFWMTQSAKQEARNMIADKLPMADVMARYGIPENEYEGIERLPNRFHSNVPDSVPKNTVFHHWGFDGTPYWSLIVTATLDEKNINWGIVTKP